jgi:hypothetical protein
VGERHRIEQERSLLQRLSQAVNDEADLGGVARSLSRLLQPLLFFDLFSSRCWIPATRPAS